MNTVTIQKDDVRFTIALSNENTSQFLIGLAVGVLIIAILAD